MVNRFSLLALLLAVLSLSCSTPTAPIAQGNISGRVYLRPRAGQIDQAKHDITVALTGNQTYTTTSLDSGAFVLSNVNQGIYSITYSKAGYFSQSIDNIQFVGNGTLKLSTVYLNQADTIIDPPDPKNGDRRVFGYVRLYDENGDSLSDHSGVNVTINGTSLTATSEKSGIFYFEKYPKGNFDITLSKAGFQDLVIPQITFPDSVSVKSKSQLQFQKYKIVELAKAPNLTIQMEPSVANRYSVHTLQNGTLDTTLEIIFNGTLTPTGYGKRIWVFTVYSDTENVTLSNYYTVPYFNVEILSNPNRTYSERRYYYYANNGDGSTRWHLDRIGRAVYFRTFVLWSRPNENTSPQYFEDPKSKRRIYSGFTASTIMKGTLPTEFIIQ